MEDQHWLSIISFMLTTFVLFVTFIGGYAVLRKRVKDLEKDSDETLTKEKHDSLCKIATLEMKNHVSDAMKETMDGFNKETFNPAIKQLLKAINGD